MSNDREFTIFAFDEPAAGGQWYSIDDAVMGGVSASKFVVPGDGPAVFAGTLSLENNGGFASVRCEPRDFQLHGFTGIRLLVKGDGRRYKLSLKTDAAFDGVQYQAEFQTEAGVWQTKQFSFESFAPMFRGRRVPNAPELDVTQIRTFGLMISDGQAGKFRLKIRSIAAYRA
ncbi:MAG: CIA30 family protein [Pyrinomonadaceae bacterium]